MSNSLPAEAPPKTEMHEIQKRTAGRIPHPDRPLLALYIRSALATFAHRA